MKTFTLLALMSLMAVSAWASHLLGGQIQARNTSGNSYEITVLLFTDAAAGSVGTSAMSSFTVCLGDGTISPINRVSQAPSSDPGIIVNTYRLTHTYGGPGIYRITTDLPNRTDMVNVSQAINTLFSLTTIIQATGSLRNTTPSFEPTSDLWQLGTNQRARLSFRATDPDGDSLSYSLTRPLTNGLSSCAIPTALTQYQFPNDVARAGTYKLNVNTGELIWDAPTRVGQYSTSILVKEWRNGIQVSESYIETVLRVIDKPGSPSTIPPYEPATEAAAVVTGNEPEAGAGISLTMAPNPVHDYLLIQIRFDKAAPASFRIHDITGRLIAEKSFGQAATAHEHVFPFQSIAAGTYILRVTTSNGRKISRTFLKQ